MIDVEALIREQFSKLDPLPATLSGDWNNVLTRVQGAPQIRSSRARRNPIRLAVVAAAAAVLAITGVVTPLGAAIGRSFGDFSAWISGSPGTPASPGDQQAFEQENERSWDGFPAGTQLRQLLQTEAAGMTFKLFGFRSGDSLCLRLVVSGPDGSTRSSCAPIAALQQAKGPALVIDANEGFGVIGKTPPPDGYLPEKASATFGIASDGVEGVIVSADDADHQALVGDNAFLYVADHPRLGVRVRSVKAVAADGSAVALPFSRAPFGTDDTLDAPTGRPVTGPKGIERHVSGGRISWLDQQQERGDPISPEHARYLTLGADTRTLLFGREIQTDPTDHTKIALSIQNWDWPKSPPPPPALHLEHKQICSALILPGRGVTGMGCSPFSRPFGSLDRALAWGSFMASGGDQYAYIDGIVSDDVHTLQLYLTDGTIQTLAVKDNTYATQLARAEFPIRIVARDEQGEIIGNEVAKNA
ncbi:MAG TPA: hypothetical protein VIJ84_06065 [Gaiellaceae bacterium]